METRPQANASKPRRRDARKGSRLTVSTAFQRGSAVEMRPDEFVRMNSIEVPLGGHEPVTRQDFPHGTNNLYWQASPRVKLWRWDFCRPGSVREEVVDRFVGIGEGIAILQAGGQAKRLVDDGRKAPGHAPRVLPSPAGNVSDNPTQLRRAMGDRKSTRLN